MNGTNKTLHALRALQLADDKQDAKVEIAFEGCAGRKGWGQKFFEYEANRDVIEFTGIRDEIKGIRGLNKAHKVVRCNPLNHLHDIEDNFMKIARKANRAQEQRDGYKAKREAKKREKALRLIAGERV